MKKLLIIALIAPLFSIAQNYAVSLIPDSLKNGCDAVKRFEELHVIIKSPSKAIIKHKYAITILNKDGDEYAAYANNYDKLIDLSDISGALFDENGKKLKSVKKRDIADVSVDDGYSLALDGREKKHDFYFRQYPYTVEYEDEQSLDGIYFLPYWQPVENEKIAVQQSTFIVETPDGYQLRYKQNNYNAQPTIVNNNGTAYTWVVNNLKGFKYEPLQPPFQEITTAVFLGASDFSFGGYSGNMNTWADLGKFQQQLNNGRDELPDNIKQDVQRLTASITDVREKVRILYEYLQSNTRYISIQLGIGGWQPFDAKYVATKKYGDCKALSNFMVSLLKQAGIKANYVLINAGNGRKGLNEDFPAPYFNHVIACVPMAKDTIWLECTSATTPAGYMGSFTGNRKALLIGDDGGHVVNTPLYTAEDNKQLRKTDALVDAEGNLTADVNTHFSGIQQETQHSLIHDANKEQRDKYLNSVLNLPTYTIDKYDYKEDKKTLPTVDEYLHVLAPNYASVSGKRLFIQADVFNKSTTKFNTDNPRKFDLLFRSAYKDIDTINITIPQGYTAENIPPATDIKNKFGSYSISYKVEVNKIFVLRVNQRNIGRYPPSDFAEFAKFYEDIYKADRSKIVFVKKDS